MTREDGGSSATDWRAPERPTRSTGTSAGIVRESGASTRRGNSSERAHSLTSIFVGFASSAAVIGALLYMQESLGLSLFITSWASSTALILSAPRDESIAPATVFTAHILCAIVGGILLVIGSHVIWLPAVAFGTAYAAMQQRGRMHPPAAANVVIPLFAPISWNHWFVAVVAGTAFLTVLAWCMAGAKART